MSDFDKAASNYDNEFSFSSIGAAQRYLVWHHIQKLQINAHHHLLEINCGTGEDANRWNSLNKKVKATDISEKMIARASLKFPEIDFEAMDILDIKSLNRNQDLIFSNFGGLNCLSPAQLLIFFNDSFNLLTKDGKLILVLMGKKCLWDRLFLTLKGRWNEKNRRNTSGFLSVNVDGTNVKTWYYSPKELKQIVLHRFEVERLNPIGLFVPPSYLERFFSRKKRMLNFFKVLDKVFQHKCFANYADHYLIVLKKIK